MDDSHNDDLTLSNKREIDASNLISGFCDASFTNDVVDVEVNATHGSSPVMIGSSIRIYFQNLKRLRSNFERFRYDCLVGNKFSEFIS
jgi:hypothetical protein